jgi:hypothetical protein
MPQCDRPRGYFMSTIPQFPSSYDPNNPPTCNMTFVEEFSAGVWDWIHGLIEFAIRDHDFTLESITTSDQPYQRHLEILDAAKDDKELRALTARPSDCKTCQYLGCFAWCSPRFCRLCAMTITVVDCFLHHQVLTFRFRVFAKETSSVQQHRIRSPWDKDICYCKARKYLQLVLSCTMRLNMLVWGLLTSWALEFGSSRTNEATVNQKTIS